jgi:hypothetical protein
MPLFQVHVPTAASIVIVVLVVSVPLAVIVGVLRRRHERRLIGEILGEPYEPDSSKSSPDAPDEDPTVVEARKRATVLGRRSPWS